MTESTAMDNRQVDVVSRGKEALGHAVALLFDAHKNGATHFRDFPATPERPRTLVFYWYEEREAHPFPVRLTVESATELVWNWLQSLKDDEYACAYDDGEVWNERGWRAFNEDWGHVFGSHYAFAGFQGRWAWLGK